MEDLALRAAERAVSCRFCGSQRHSLVADLGTQVPANAFVPPERAQEAEERFPLRAVVCHDCWLVGLDYVVPPETIFRNYAYLSSYSPSWVQHAARFVDTAVARFGLGARSMVLEIASNDGYLLQHVVERGIGALGVEPAENIAALAQSRGIATEVAFFDPAVADRLRRRGVSADLVVANNVLAHVPSPGSIVAGLPLVLAPDGVVSIEVPHLQCLLQGSEFDTIYHEHYSYFSLGFLRRLLDASRLRVFDVERLTTHGGSLRVLACHRSSPRPTEPTVAQVVADEIAAGLEQPETFARFGTQVLRVRHDLLAFLAGARREGRTVAGYGAAAKGNTLLNYCGIGADDIRYVVDLNPLKQGHLMPQSRIPVLAPERLAETRPDYVLILPWNLRDEIVRSMSHIRDWGGRFVVAVPRLELV